MGESDALASVCRLEWGVQQRAEELRRDMALLVEAKRQLVCQEAAEDFKKAEERDFEDFEQLLHSQVEATLADLDRHVAPARELNVRLTGRAEALAAELLRVRAEAQTRLEGLQEAAQHCELELRMGCQEVIALQRRRREERNAAEVQLLLGEMRKGGDSMLHHPALIAVASRANP